MQNVLSSIHLVPVQVNDLVPIFLCFSLEIHAFQFVSGFYCRHCMFSASVAIVNSVSIVFKN